MRYPDLAVDDRATAGDVTAAYRLLLGRRPDPDGFHYFTSRAEAHGLTLDELARTFVASDEFRERNRVECDLVAVDLGGYKVCVDRRETDIGRELAESGQYEEHVRAAVRELLRPGQTFVDVGANVGCVALLAAAIAGPSGRVIAVEANPENVQRLFGGIALNGFGNVRVLPFAASDRCETFSLGGGSNAYLVGAKDFAAGGFYAQSVVLDDLLAGVPAVDFIKMDIEGHEPFALRGLDATIRRHDPILLTEFSPRCLRLLHGQEPVSYLNQLFSHYRRLRVISPFHDDATFEDAASLMDCWRERDADVDARGILPAGAHHFDLIGSNRGD